METVIARINYENGLLLGPSRLRRPTDNFFREQVRVWPGK